ncbi:MAG: class I tRNA ligase family protein [Patescibacteria group bacterium]
MVEPKFTNTRDESAVHEGEPYVKRNAVAAVIRNPKTDKYLCISWKTIRMHGLVTGGVEEGEDIVEAAKRETREETGYKNIRLVRDPQVAIHSLFYHRVKEQNRWARFQYLFFELENEERDPVDEKEAALHEVLWLDEKEMANFFTVVEGEFVMNLLKNPNYIHTGEGVMRNSGQFDGMDSEAAGKAIINQLVGKKTSNIVYIHGSSGRDKRNDPDYITPNLRHWHGWFVRELSEKGYDVENPEMPRDWAPVYEEWKEKFDQVYVDENTILIGDSAGGAFVLRWLGETKRKIGHLILIAPTLELEPKEKRLVDFIDYTLDKGITERASGVTVYISNDTPARLSSAKKIAHTLGATIVSIPGRGHFTLMDSAKNNQFPELLDEVIRITSKSVPTYNNSLARFAVQYKLRDWVFSRQHYWGEPIPIIHCDKCGVVPVPAKDLPVELPHVEKYLPTDTGESPLANMTKWVNTKCPQCGGPAKRETDTMPNWAGSSWYYLRYCDPHNTKKFAEFDKMKYWLPVDIYNGGMEHTVLHLLYSRFWHKFLFDQKLVPSAEPYKHRHSHGLVLAEDGRKMSKSWGNVINPDDVVKKYGADTLRTYEMFMGPFEDAIPWSTQGMVGVYRFLDRVYKVISSLGMERKTLVDTPGMSIKIHKLVKKVTEDLERFRFNTVVSSMMEYFNDRDFASKLSHEGQLEGNSVDYEAVNKFLVLLFPFAPHIASELWEQINGGDIQKESWPTFDSKCLKDENFELIVQINGKVRGKIPNVTTGINQAGAVAAVIANEKLKDKLAGYKKVVYVPNRLINFIL